MTLNFDRFAVAETDSSTMLIPQTRLLTLVALGVAPAAVLGGLRPELTFPAALCGGALLLAAVVDGWLGAGRAGRGLRFEFPEVVRLTKGRTGTIPLVVGNERPGGPARVLRLGLDLPASVATPREELAVALAAGAGRTLLPWPCTPGRRGRFACGRLYYQEASLLGLWAVRRSAGPGPAGCELRVYPDLRAERRQSAAFLSRRGPGSHARRQVGRGREFEKLRDYVAGDSIEDISWKATARRQRPVSKVFQVERTQEVYVILDASRLSARPAATAPLLPAGAGGSVAGEPGPAPEPVTVLERYVASTLMLCLAAERQGDLFGLAAFSDQVRQFLRARHGPAHFGTCRETIYALEPAPVSPDFEELGAFLRLRLRRRALLLILTSLDDPTLAESFVRGVESLSRQHLVLVNTLRPAGAVPLFADADGGAAVRTTEDVYRRLGGHLQWQRLRESGHRLRRLGVQFTLLDPARMTEQLVTQYVSVKQRQIL